MSSFSVSSFSVQSKKTNTSRLRPDFAQTAKPPKAVEQGDIRPAVDVHQALADLDEAGQKMQAFHAEKGSAAPAVVPRKERTGSIGIRFSDVMDAPLRTAAIVDELHALRSSGDVGAVTLNSGLQLAGVLADVKLNDAREPIFLRFSGPTQLAHKSAQIDGQGGDYHTGGYSSPVGPLKTGQRLSEMTGEDLAKIGIINGNDVVDLEFASGIKVSGKVKDIGPDAERPLIIAFTDCTVTFEDEKLFRPGWGTFDMAIGESVQETALGAADHDAFNAHLQKDS